MKPYTAGGLILMLGLLLLSGCATVNPPSPLLETEVHQLFNPIQAQEPQEKLYRQYVEKGFYMQLERMDENNIIYGWYTCTNCTWTRSKLLAKYDGSYLYVIYGHHENFIVQPPQYRRHHPDMSHWSWSVIDKYQVEGRNLILRGQTRKCESHYPQIREWINAPWSNSDGEIDCELRFTGNYQRLFVATIDDTLAGKSSSIVERTTESLSSRLATLRDLYESSLIDKEEYDTRRQEILQGL